MTPLLALADERFVSLTTFRRSGEAVPTPVWVGRDGDVLVERLRGRPRTLRLALDITPA